MMGDFLRHLFPHRVRRRDLTFSYTFCLGGLAVTTFLVLAASGLLLLFYYRPGTGTAYSSIRFLESAVWGGRYLRSLHRFASHVLLVLVLLHAMRVVLTGAYAHPREGTWLVGSGLGLLVISAAYTGYLLPMDQPAYWASRTGMELLRVLPLGDHLRALLVPDRVGGPLSLQRFYALHIAVIPVSMLMSMVLHFWSIRRRKGVLPYL